MLCWEEVNQDSSLGARPYTRAMGGLTRRRLLAGAAGAGFAASLPIEVLAAVRPRHQPGIAPPAQSRLYFAPLDTTAPSRRELRELLRSGSAPAPKPPH